jgi:hypothetical protein
LYFDQGRLVETPFISFYRKLSAQDQAKLQLVFFQLCQTTPVVLQTLRSLATSALFTTGQAAFTKYHLDQLLESLFGRVTKSTCERIRQILILMGRLELQGKNYVAGTSCPSDPVLGYGLYADAQKHGWRAPSTSTIVEQGDLCPTFLCSRPLLVVGLQRLSSRGACEFHKHAQTDQVQLTYPSLEHYVNVWTN